MPRQLSGPREVPAPIAHHEVCDLQGMKLDVVLCLHHLDESNFQNMLSQMFLACKWQANNYFHSSFSYKANHSSFVTNSC